MLKQKLKLITVVIAGSCLVGCSAVPKARITNVDSFTVAQTVYENGAASTEYVDDAFMAPMMDDMFDQMFGKFIKVPKTDPNTLKKTITVWPEPEIIHNNQKTTVQYSLSGIMFNSTHRRDTIKFYVPQSGETILSLKCKKKETELFNIIKWLLPYERDYDREKMLMVNTSNQLQADHQAHIEWLGKWRPDPNSL